MFKRTGKTITSRRHASVSTSGTGGTLLLLSDVHPLSSVLASALAKTLPGLTAAFASGVTLYRQQFQIARCTARWPACLQAAFSNGLIADILDAKIQAATDGVTQAKPALFAGFKPSKRALETNTAGSGGRQLSNTGGITQ